MELIQYQLIEETALLTINRPANLNALNSQVIRELDDTLHELESRPALKAVVLTGAGEKAFVAGGDIKEMFSLDVEAARGFSQNGQRLILFLKNMQKPVIAAVNGYALGGGLELALACDFIYAAETARFGLPEVTLGVLPGFGGTQNLPRLIGPARAKEMIFTGQILSAQTALEWGLVNAVFPAPDLLKEALATAGRIAGNGSAAVASAKQAIVRGLDQSRLEGFETENGLFAELFETADQKEGMQAFMDKRNPEFKGR